eukprot:scaffold130391_cov44-Attheya_sp.AAC.1
MACSDDLDDSVVVGAVPGNITWGSIGASSPSPSSPLPLVQTKEDHRRQLKRESAARSYTPKAPKKKKSKVAAKKKSYKETARSSPLIQNLCHFRKPSDG